MSSHSATALLAEKPSLEGKLEVRLQLACGCVIETTILSDRVISTVDGSRRAVGKYSCPLAHPVRSPRAE